MNVMPISSDRSACLAELRRRIGVIERGRFSTESIGEAKPAAFDATKIDPFLAGGGEGKPALHELVADGYGSRPSVRDFGLALAASLLHRQ